MIDTSSSTTIRAAWQEFHDRGWFGLWRASVREFAFWLDKETARAAYDTLNDERAYQSEDGVTAMLYDHLNGRVHYASQGRNPVTGQAFNSRYGGRGE